MPPTKTVNTRENFWNVYCFATNQKQDETAKDNRQTAACFSHDLIQNDELAFSSNELAFLSQLTFKNQTTEFGIDLEARFTTVLVFLLSYKNLWIENRQSQPTSITLWTAHEAHQSAPLLIGSFFLSNTLSSLVWSYLLDSTSLSRKYVTKHIIHNLFFAHKISWNTKKKQFQYLNSKIEDLLWKKNPARCFESSHD